MRARIAFELAARAEDPGEPFGSGAAPGTACELYRESCYFSLLALEEDSGELTTFPELLTRADPTLVASTTSDGEATAALHALLLERSFIDFARAPRAEQEQALAALRRLATELLRRWEQPEKDEEQSSHERRLHVVVVMLALGLGSRLAWGPANGWLTSRNDLAAGKPWRTSSVWATCKPAEHRCGGTDDTDIFFHTKDEDSPWLEIDLGARTKFSHVYVRNRSDCCEERAVPLIVETSNDQRHWDEAARRKSVFQTWTAKFSPRTARWVRLRVPAKTMFHLEAVRVLP